MRRLEQVYRDAEPRSAERDDDGLWNRYRACVDGDLVLKHGKAGIVYFIAAVPDDLAHQHRADLIHEPSVDRVKIGFSRGIRQRMAGLRTGSPLHLTLLAFLPGTLRDEAEWHLHFDEHRIRGEWFAMSDDLRELILDAQACVSGAELVDAAVDHLTRARIRMTRKHGPDSARRELESWLSEEGRQSA